MGKVVMKKTYLLVLAAVFMLGAVASAPAFALTFNPAEWLINGAAIVVNKPIDILGEILVENVLNGAAMVCSALFEGVAKPGGGGEITKMFNLAGVEIRELPSALACTNQKTCEAPEISPDGLPFLIEPAEDAQDGKFYVFTTDSFELSCTIVGVKVEELCGPEQAGTGIGGEIFNLATDFELAAATEPRALCNNNAAEGDLVNIGGNLISSTAGNLSIS